MLNLQPTRSTLFPATCAFLVVLATASASGASVFSTELAFVDDGQSHRMQLTGEDERVFLMFRVYAIAHYAETAAGDALSAPGGVVVDGPSKAIVLRFARKLGRDRIRAEFAKTLRRNAEPQWLERAGPSIDAFIETIDRDAAAGDEIIYYWLEGGRVIAEFNGERMFSVTDADFAKLIWSIWFGADPVCNREKLLAEVSSRSEPIGQ